MRILVDHGGANGIGDIVMQLPLYQALADCYPGARISSRGSREIALGNPSVAELDESSPLAAFDRHVRATWLGDHPIRLSEQRTLVEAFLLAAGLPPTYGPPRAYLFPHEVNAFELPAEAADRPVIAFSADSVSDPAKRWDLGRYTTLLRHLGARYDAIIFELGAGYSASYLGIGANLIGRTSIRQAMALLYRCDLYVGNPGGLAHLADAVGTPLLSPWGSAVPPRDYLWHPRSIMVSPDLPCKHCFYRGQRRPECNSADPARGLAICTAMITVDEMIAAAEDLVESLMAQREGQRVEKASYLAQPGDFPRRLEADVAVTPERNAFEIVGQVSDPSRLLGRPFFLATPEWRRADSAWAGIVRGYATRAGPGYPFGLWLLAGPDQEVTLLDVRELVGRCLAEAGLDLAEAPPIVLVGGYVGPDQLAWLLRRAKAYLVTGGANEPARTARARQHGCPVLARVP